MTNKNSFDKSEVGKILNEASKIQVERERGMDEEGLDWKELEQVAKELGIDTESLLLAIRNKQYEFDESYSWLKGTAEIHQIFNIDGKIDAEHHKAIIQELRRITGFTGKAETSTVGFEWGNQEDEIGHFHVSLSENGDQTHVQITSSWKPLKLLGNVLSVMAGSLLILISFKEIYWKELAMMVAPLGGLIGFAMNRFFMKRYFSKQKAKLQQVSASISNILHPVRTPDIQIDDELPESSHTENSGPNKKLKT